MIRLATLALAALVPPAAAGAECSVSADAGAAPRPVAATAKGDADLLVSMTMMPRLMKVSYDGVVRDRPKCALSTFRVGADEYTLRGEDAHGRQRVALPATKGRPAATVLPVVNVMAAIEASKAGKAAPTEGYMLAVVAPGRFTGVRLYTGMPDAATLATDMADALSGKLPALFATNAATGQTEVFVGG